MPRDGATTFDDLLGQLAELRVTCDKCGRSGRYRLDRLIAHYGRDVNGACRRVPVFEIELTCCRRGRVVLD
jgi:hypothetical protein